jgi:hypothetical protein
MELRNYSLPKVAFVAVLLLYGISGGLNPDRFWLLNGVDLAFHEFGHMAFAMFGDFIQFAGGTLMQLLIPLAIAAYFYRRGEHFSSAVALFWVAQNFFNIAVYAADARTQALPLVGGGIHDWGYLLGRTGLLESDGTIAGVFKTVGWALIFFSIGWALKSSRLDEEELVFPS